MVAMEDIAAAHTTSSDDRDMPWTATVTGGASGIGAATVRKLASRSINVLVADMAVEAGQKLTEEVKSQYKIDAIFQHVDVRKEESVIEMVQTAVRHWGRVDYAANCAGICQDGAELKNDESKAPIELIDITYEINQRGIWLCQKHIAAQMLRQPPRTVTFHPPPPKPLPPQRGSIVNIASTASLAGLGYPAYTPTKHAVVGITKNGAYYYGQHGIRCNAVSPGGTVTPLSIGASPAGIKEMLAENDPKLARNVPLGKSAWPEEVANVVGFLLSAESSHVCGVNLEVDGGWGNTRFD